MFINNFLLLNVQPSFPNVFLFSPFALTLSIFLLSLFLIIRCLIKSDTSIKYNTFLYEVYKSIHSIGDYIFFLGIGLVILAIVSFLFSVGLLSAYFDVVSNSGINLHFSIACYSTILILMFYFVVQPNISETISLKRQHKKLYNNLVDKISKEIVNANFNNYEGQTKVFIEELENDMIKIQNQVKLEEKISGKVEIKKSITKLERLEFNYHDLLSKYKSLQSKEKVVHKFLSDIRLSLLIDDSNSHLHKILNFLDEVVKSDVLQAHDYVETFKENGLNNIKKVLETNLKLYL